MPVTDNLISITIARIVTTPLWWVVALQSAHFAEAHPPTEEQTPSAHQLLPLPRLTFSE
jgi:hypothetical protein